MRSRIRCSYSRPAGRTDLTPEKLKRRIDLLVLPLSVPPLCLPSRPTSNRLFLSLEVKRMAEMTQRSCSSCTSLWQCSRSLRSRRPRSNRNSGACRLVGSESSVASNTSVAILSPSGRPATRPSELRGTYMESELFYFRALCKVTASP